jgi:hypothetical protein
MAILKELLDQTAFSQVWDVLRAADNDAEQYREAYEKLFDLLKSAEPAENTQQMTIKLEVASDPWIILGDDDEEDSAEPEDYVQVFGYIPGDEDGYAIGLKEPAQLAGMDIHPETLQEYDVPTILAHILAEITYSHTTTESLWSPKMDTYAGGLYASTACTENDLGGLSIEALRKELGVDNTPEQEDYKEKYGFLF